MRCISLVLATGVCVVLTMPSLAADTGQCAPMLADFDKAAAKAPQNPMLSEAVAMRNAGSVLCNRGMHAASIKYLDSAFRVLGVPPPSGSSM